MQLRTDESSEEDFLLYIPARKRARVIQDDSDEETRPLKRLAPDRRPPRRVNSVDSNELEMEAEAACKAAVERSTNISDPDIYNLDNSNCLIDMPVSYTHNNLMAVPMIVVVEPLCLMSSSPIPDLSSGRLGIG